ncbi:substrate-binding domain-containing protein [Pseudonocardia kujensis]|uniref:sugar ABC transporter substrate-binding protein n=1 Tax=Pseudonocardia kujensis TaxID=1128675 RepID=UPI001E42E5DA|nr:substrate-binding domain-containing protein [Pseudonocardia kujensis]MCE0763512.1 substrate-binding domain-containing protein [Pseudonocardia kujensis]
MRLKPMRWSGRLAVGLAASSALLLSACGGSGDSLAPAMSPEQTQACMAKAAAGLADYEKFPTTLPASPPARYTTLNQRPPAGKRIIMVRQNFPATANAFAGVQEAAASLGWTAEAIVYDTTVPDFVAKMDQAIASKPDFIMETGLPVGSFQKQVDAAKAAGITVLTASTSDAPVSVPGYGGSADGADTAKLIGRVQAFKAMQDSHCTGNTAVFSMDYPVLKLCEDAYVSTVADLCPTCRVDVQKLQAKDLGTPAATAQMVSKLQSDPSVGYAYTIIGSGLAQALKPAGLENVKIFGQVPNETSIADLRKGTNAWWINQSSTIEGYDLVDMAARITVTGQLQSDPGGFPLALLTPQNVPAGQGSPVVSANILDLYKATWKVGSSS